MRKAYIRIWQNLDLDDVQKHLLIAGDISGDCANCKEIGLNFQTTKVCPKCKTEFKYIATRASKASREAKRLKSKRPDLIVIDFSDFKEAQSRDQARKFIGG